MYGLLIYSLRAGLCLAAFCFFFKMGKMHHNTFQGIPPVIQFQYKVIGIVFGDMISYICSFHKNFTGFYAAYIDDIRKPASVNQ